MKKKEKGKYEYTKDHYLIPSLTLKEGEEGIIYRVGLYENYRFRGGGYDVTYWSHHKSTTARYAVHLTLFDANKLVECYAEDLLVISRILRAPLEELQELRRLEWKLEQEITDYRRGKNSAPKE